VTRCCGRARRFCARMAGSTCCSTRTQPQKLVSSRAFASPIVHCSTAPARPHPADATSAPIRQPACPPRRCAPNRHRRRPMTRPAHPPEVVPRLLAPVTAQPAAFNSPAQALPMPADAPVTSTRLAPPLTDALISWPAPAARRTSQPSNRMPGTTPSQQNNAVLTSFTGRDGLLREVAGPAGPGPERRRASGSGAGDPVHAYMCRTGCGFWPGRAASFRPRLRATGRQLQRRPRPGPNLTGDASCPARWHDQQRIPRKAST
jgi:hypothetical protein